MMMIDDLQKMSACLPFGHIKRKAAQKPLRRENIIHFRSKHSAGSKVSFRGKETVGWHKFVRLV